MARTLIIVENTDVTDVSTVEDLILARSQLKILKKGYAEFGLESPEWIADQLEAIGAEMQARSRSELMRQLRTLEAQEAQMKPKAERRAEVQSQISYLKSRLAVAR